MTVTSNSAIALDAKMAEKFAELCRQAHSAWIIHKTLYDDNPSLGNMGRSACIEFLGHLNPITREYALHQIIKLHDPANQSGRQNLTLDFVIKCGAWDSKTLNRLSSIRQELEVLLPVADKSDGLGAARNRILSHNDLETILQNRRLGEFAVGNDLKYFERLSEFATIVCERYTGGPFIFDDFPEFDTRQFLLAIQPKRA